MLKDDGIGAGYGLTDGSGGSSHSGGFGDIWSTQQICSYSWGDGCGSGHRGDGFGDGHGDVTHCTPSNAPYFTLLVIGTDPITTAYQAATMQTSGEHRV